MIVYSWTVKIEKLPRVINLLRESDDMGSWHDVNILQIPDNKYFVVVIAKRKYSYPFVENKIQGSI